ncbi:MAG: hypothetical protein JHD02_05810 [Thermoleophilaceae bacterium]|nr:hypothetical protein [Thermoleophilaceae bacterium]
MSRAGGFALAAALCALLAGWMTFSYTGSAAQKDGPLRDVLVAEAPLEQGAQLDTGRALAVRQVPSRFAPPDALSDPSEAVGERLQAPVPDGGFVTRSILSGGASATPRFKLRAAERALTVDAVVSPIGESLQVGDRVDLYASGFGGAQRTETLISGAEVLAAQESAAAGRTRATLRLARSQTAAVVRADVFAHELRAVVVP